MSLVHQVAKSLLNACLPRRRLLVSGARCPSGTNATVSLTFDDGPDADITPRVLDALQEARLRATFFVIGEKAQRFPEIVRRIVAEGHELGNHTLTHQEPAKTSTDCFLGEVEATNAILESIAGVRPKLVRPPKGELTIGKLTGLWRRGFVPVLWNVDPKDFRMKQLDEMREWCRSWKPRSGDIVLLHDNRPFAADAIRELTSLGTWNRFQTACVSHWITNSGFVTRLEESAA